jgi:hypothetical protein
MHVRTHGQRVVSQSQLILESHETGYTFAMSLSWKRIIIMNVLFHSDESLAEDIVNGIDRAAVVLVCMTQKYYESPYCKKGMLLCSNITCTVSRPTS